LFLVLVKRFLSIRLLACFLSLSGSMVLAGNPSRFVWQPVMEYLLGQDVQPKARGSQEPFGSNPFVQYTHIGTDFGFHGPGERFLSYDNGRLTVDLSGSADWTGMWHSMAGLARETERTLDFLRPAGEGVLDGCQARVNSVMIEAQGCGTLKLEIKAPDEKVLWEKTLQIDSPKPGPIHLPVSPHAVRNAKFLNWTAEPGSNLTFSALRLGVEFPVGSPERHLLLASYGKLLRCWSPDSGLIRDRAHIEAGAFDSIPASGYFALAAAVMAHESVGMVESGFARRAVWRLHDTLLELPKAKGLLPHFVKRMDGRLRIHPGTEFSSIDTAICLQALLLAGIIMDEKEIVAAALKLIKAVDIKALRMGDGAISHGFQEDGVTRLPYAWRDWGGETALVLLMSRMSAPEDLTAVMEKTGRVWQGTGFIAEIQSLFHPDFDSSRPDALTGVNWLAAREAMLVEQKAYFPKQQPDSFAAKNGFFGLSAGEGVFGKSYVVGGVELTGQSVIHPHYFVMSAALEKEPKAVHLMLRRLAQAGCYHPLGLVETIAADGVRRLPMIGGLNAGFEVLGAYHLYAKSEKKGNVIYEASRKSPEIRSAMRLFYPQSVAQQ
jgi:hypothetical protein